MSLWAEGIRGASYRKVVVVKLSSNFREATEIQQHTLPTELAPDQVIIRTKFVGINASDINFTAGHYLPGVSPPFDAGFEAVGEVVAVGERSATKVQLGSAVATTAFGAFAEYLVVDSPRTLLPIASSTSDMLPLLVSGLTASIALEEVGDLKTGETVLVTAAAGGTGQFAVQIAKQKGCRVLGTCSSDRKKAFLESIGCDRVINYKTEDLYKTLKSECPNGLDVVYESVGGSFFESCVSNLAIKGRLVVIGMISGYKDGSAWQGNENARASLPAKLLTRSASVRGFFLNHYMKLWKKHLLQMSQDVQQGTLKSGVDLFAGQGVDSIADAIDYMYGGKNMGKVVVAMEPTTSRL